MAKKPTDPYDIPEYNPYPEMMDEEYEGMRESGLLPKDLPRKEDQEEYQQWLDAHPE